MSDDEHSISVAIPTDSDGFLRRECPNCEQQFKWFNHGENNPDAEHVDQYFCPLCGLAAGLGEWWTPEQLDYARSMAAPEINHIVQDMMKDAFKGVKGVTFKPNQNFGVDDDVPEPFIEPDDMVIVEPPCHPNEPVKVPDEAATNVHCLICGTPFST